MTERPHPGVRSGIRRLVPAAVLLAALWGGPAAAQMPIHLPLPDGWREEYYAEMPAFMGENDFEGWLELRFPPGFLEEGDPGFLTYAAVWFLDGRVGIGEAMLRNALTQYYRGLFEEVGRERFPDLDVSDTRVDRVRAGEKTVRLHGHTVRRWNLVVSGYDVFRTGNPLELHMNIDTWYCRERNETVLFFRIGPGRPDEAREDLLWEIFEGFHCHAQPIEQVPRERKTGPRSKTKLRFG